MVDKRIFSGQEKLFSTLPEMLNPKHPLYKLAAEIFCLFYCGLANQSKSVLETKIYGHLNSAFLRNDDFRICC